MMLWKLNDFYANKSTGRKYVEVSKIVNWYFLFIKISILDKKR